MIKKVHQFAPDVYPATAVTDEIFAFQKVLRRFGYDSEIYGDHIHPALSNIVRSYSAYREISSPANILIIHYSLGSPVFKSIASLQDKKILRYHDIASHKWFANINRELASLCKKGEEELSMFKDVELVLSVSEYCKEDLVEAGFKNIQVLPLLIDYEKFGVGPDESILKRFDDDFINILCVARVIPHKKIEDVIMAFYHYLRFFNPKSRLFVIGSREEGRIYSSEIEYLVKALNLENVHLIRRVIGIKELIAYYKLADIYLHMSEWEGFCVPLAESMYFKIPIIAYNFAAVPETLGDAGILVNKKDYLEIAEKINLVVEDSSFRNRIIESETRRLRRFNRPDIEKQLGEFIKQVSQVKD